MNTTDARQRVHGLVDQLPAAQLAAVEGLLSAMVDSAAHSLAKAPVDNEAISEEEAAALRRSEQWFRDHGGKGIPMEEVMAEFGLSVEDFPLEKLGD